MTVSHPIVTEADADELRRPPRAVRRADSTRPSPKRGALPATGLHSAAVHPPGHARADAAVRRHAAGAESVRRRRSRAGMATCQAICRRRRRPRLRAEAEKIVARDRSIPPGKRAIACRAAARGRRPPTMRACGASRTARPPTRRSLRRFTTTNLTADEIHQIGLSEVARIEQEMDAHPAQARASAGLGQGSHRAAEEGPELSADRGRTHADHGRRRRDPPRRARQRAASHFDRAPESARRRAALPAVPGSQRRRQLHRARPATDRGPGSSRSRCGRSG